MEQSSPESEKFDATVRKVLSVSRDELKRREKEWKKQQAQKKRTKISSASRASNGKD